MPLDSLERERIRDDLAQVVHGDVLFDDLSRALYSTDASVYRIEPLGVVVPRTADDIVTTVELARRHSVSITAPRSVG